MSKPKVWVFVVGTGEARNYVETFYSRLPAVGEYVSIPDDPGFFRVDMVVHPGDPSAGNEGEIFVTEVDYMDVRSNVLNK